MKLRKNRILTDALREIRNTFSRFVSLLVLSALAVCFLAAGAVLLYNRFRPHDPAKLYVNQLRASAEPPEPSTQSEDHEEES